MMCANQVNVILNISIRLIIDHSEEDMTEAAEQRVTKKLKKLLKRKLSDNIICNQLKPGGSGLPDLYGILKNESDVPVRPLLSMINSPFHTFARCLVSKLEPICSKLSVHRSKDTFQFTQLLEKSGPF